MVNTLTLDYIVNEYGENIFDFNYVFPLVSIDGEPFTKSDLEAGFIEYFQYYQIGFSTIDEFKWRLKRKWHELIRQLSKQLIIDETTEYGLQHEIETLSRKLTNTDTMNGSNVLNGNQINDNQFSDTPNQDMGTMTNPNFLTERTKDEMNINNTNTYTQSKNKTDDENVTREKYNNAVEQLNALYDKIHNFIYEFYKKFNSLFITDVVIERGILYV